MERKAEVIVVTNQKGGVGKSTTAEALAEGLHIRGRHTLLIDLDPQGSATLSSNADVADNINSTKVELNSDSSEFYTAYEMLMHKPVVNAADAIQRREHRTDIIPASAHLSELDKNLPDIGKDQRLKKKLEPIRPEYDYIVIDTPPALSLLTINALTAAEYVVMPTQADLYSLQGIGQLYDTIEAVVDNTNPELKLGGILLTRHNERTVLSREMAEEARAKAEAIGTFVYDAVIRECVALREAQSVQRTIYEYAPASNAAHDYTAFVDEFIRRNHSEW